MKADDVLRIYRQLELAGARIWVDGGWAVDALLGEQTRPHSDLDIIIEKKNLPVLSEVLGGWQNVPRSDTSAWNFVLGDEAGRLVDVHVIVLDEHGNGIYGPPGHSVFAAASLTGLGTIGGCVVRCIAPEYLVEFHTGYELRDTDIHDVSALCARFGIPLPKEYESRVIR